MNEQDLKKIFTSHKTNICDDGFTERVTERLPERKSILPQIIMVVFIMIGLVLTFAILGLTSMLEQINSLITSISLLQAPSPIAVLTYLSMMGLIGIIGYSVVQVDAG